MACTRTTTLWLSHLALVPLALASPLVSVRPRQDPAYAQKWAADLTTFEIGEAANDPILVAAPGNGVQVPFQIAGGIFAIDDPNLTACQRAMDSNIQDRLTFVPLGVEAILKPFAEPYDFVLIKNYDPGFNFILCKESDPANLFAGDSTFPHDQNQILNAYQSNMVSCFAPNSRDDKIHGMKLEADSGA